tara:strand:+ start:1295 stop:1663 length:369 start_codon:yes stop_codon:yes gene_type:complete
MTNYSNNPQTLMNTFQSALRNTLLSTTLGITIYGFGSGFKNKDSRYIMKIISLFIYIYAFCFGILSTTMLRRYIRKIDKAYIKKRLPDYVDINFWKIYEILGYVFCILILILFGLSFHRLME